VGGGVWGVGSRRYVVRGTWYVVRGTWCVVTGQGHKTTQQNEPVACSLWPVVDRSTAPQPRLLAQLGPLLSQGQAPDQVRGRLPEQVRDGPGTSQRAQPPHCPTAQHPRDTESRSGQAPDLAPTRLVRGDEGLIGAGETPDLPTLVRGDERGSG